MKHLSAALLFTFGGISFGFSQSILSIDFGAAGQPPVLVISGDSGSTYQIERSSDLQNFDAVDSVTLTEASFTWPIENFSGTAFFRLREETVTEPSYQIETLPGVQFVTIPAGSFIMGNNNAMGPIASDFKPERTVNMSEFSMSEAEITNAQYLEFLNAAMADGLIEVITLTMGPPGTYVYGTDSSSYEGHKLIDLSGTRVLKDHTGDSVIDPENPLNQCWIEWNEADQKFQIKDPQAIDWDAYVFQEGESRADWEDLAVDQLPDVATVSQWPATFIKWYGAHAFAEYYGVSLPTEAQWEYAAQGGAGHKYASDDGTMDATKANYNELNSHPDRGHVVAVKSYTPNPFGIYDLAGNVWEWCADWYDPDFYSTQPDPDTDPFNGVLVVEETEAIESPTYTGGPGQAYNGDTKAKRGGSWNFHQASLESTARERDFTWRGNDHFGFRLVNNTAR